MSAPTPPSEPIIPPGTLSYAQIRRLIEADEAAKQKIRDELQGAVANARGWFIDGFLAKLGAAFRGESVTGLETVTSGIRQGIFGGIADAIRDVEDLGERLMPIRDAARALIRPVEDRMLQVEESQLSAEEQLALLEGVRGYGAAYQPRNYGGNVNSVALDFTAPMGPMKGVSIDPIFKGLRVNEPGLWLVSVRATGRATVATNGLGQQDRTELTVREYPPGTPSREVATMTGDGGNGRVSNTMTFPMVIEKAGTTIAVDAYSSRWRRWDGGKLYSSLSVTKLDSRLETPGDWTVPDA